MPKTDPVAWRYWISKWQCWGYSDCPLIFPAVPAGTEMTPIYLTGTGPPVAWRYWDTLHMCWGYSDTPSTPVSYPAAPPGALMTPLFLND